MRRLMGLGEMPECQQPLSTLRTCVLASDLFSVPDNLLTNLVKVVELLTRKVQELSPLVLVGLVELSLGHGVFWLLIVLLPVAIGLVSCRTVDQLKDLLLSVHTLPRYIPKVDE